MPRNLTIASDAGLSMKKPFHMITVVEVDGEIAHNYVSMLHSDE
jgi:hypothetical protein